VSYSARILYQELRRERRYRGSYETVNRLVAPLRESFGEGISREGEILQLGAEHGVLEKTGAWYAFDGDRLGKVGFQTRRPSSSG
jgi:hypothetical protein